MKIVQAVSSRFRNACIAVTGFAMANSAFAIDTTAVTASIASAEADGLTVGEAVIGAVAALVVVGLIIGLVRKL